MSFSVRRAVVFVFLILAAATVVALGLAHHADPAAIAPVTDGGIWDTVPNGGIWGVTPDGGIWD